MIATKTTRRNERQAKRGDRDLPLSQQCKRGDQRQDDRDAIERIGNERFAALLKGVRGTRHPGGEAVRDGEVSATEVEVLQARPPLTERRGAPEEMRNDRQRDSKKW